MPVIINELEVIVEEEPTQATATRNATATRPSPTGLRPIDVVQIVDREAERRARLRAD